MINDIGFYAIQIIGIVVGTIMALVSFSMALHTNVAACFFYIVRSNIDYGHRLGHCCDCVYSYFR